MLTFDTRVARRCTRMGKLRILIADDHEAVREGLKAILNRHPDFAVVGEAVDGTSAVAQTKQLLPDLVIMDVSMPDLNGLAATQAIKAACPKVNVIALTRHADDGYLQQLLTAGASGYVLKQSRSAELVHAIRAVNAGGTYLDPAVAGRVVREFRRDARPTVGRSEPLPLSPREEMVLRLVAWGNSNKDIASQLSITVKTVETHKTNAMHKLGLDNRLAVVKYAVLQGWLRDEA